eukprot:CAMPEP_0204187486 /NCGR_PEP_ID=MMETSP0361-20130328/56835_1 /ASSEMBLY_ACC=CAM_ASM_000343 /TAXON_ID=268821 /ORGANISM="Scrippsiella Hangoei, Strain SHTV-5" /LENGTH=154 /DNA_ID=CAMNT_0051147893 /DNA_START=105 /DNA_END=570 /DNA_ORIENTATION=-
MDGLSGVKIVLQYVCQLAGLDGESSERAVGKKESRAASPDGTSASRCRDGLVGLGRTEVQRALHVLHADVGEIVKDVPIDGRTLRVLLVGRLCRMASTCPAMVGLGAKSAHHDERWRSDQPQPLAVESASATDEMPHDLVATSVRRRQLSQGAA